MDYDIPADHHGPLPRNARQTSRFNSVELRALQYVHNTGRCATKENFITDHEPISDVLWSRLFNQGLIAVTSDNHIVLSNKGNAALETSR